MRNKYVMKTYTALVSAKVGNTTRMVKTEVKATSSAEAKWLLQAIYGFHDQRRFSQACYARTAKNQQPKSRQKSRQ
jgi:hypothetical protein